MFDLITITTPPLPRDKIEQIVWRNGLHVNTRNKAIYYDNLESKNLRQHQGIYIHIGIDGRLKIEGSLHKYYNELKNYERSNHNLFTMMEAKEAIYNLLHERSIDIEDACIYNYEVGLNLNVQNDCITYLDKMQNIGIGKHQRLLYVNPKYRDERVKTSVFHQHTRKYFKIYDKVFELKDKRRKLVPEGNILRIETVNRRVNNIPIAEFFSADNLTKQLETFFRDWRTLRFNSEIITPKGFGRAKRQLCIEMLSKGKEKLLKEAKAQHTNYSLSDWEYRNIKSFVKNEWPEVNKQIRYNKSIEELEIKQLMDENYTILKHEEIHV